MIWSLQKIVSLWIKELLYFYFFKQFVWCKFNCTYILKDVLILLQVVETLDFWTSRSNFHLKTNLVISTNILQGAGKNWTHFLVNKAVWISKFSKNLINKTFFVSKYSKKILLETFDQFSMVKNDMVKGVMHNFGSSDKVGCYMKAAS